MVMLVMLAGCTTAEQGAVIGGLGGAAIGGAVTGRTSGAVAGGLIGAVGGFGAGSDITWDLLAGVGYQYNEHISFALGYRAMGVDYDHDGFVYDVVEHGPVLGTVFKF